MSPLFSRLDIDTCGIDEGSINYYYGGTNSKLPKMDIDSSGSKGTI